MSRTIWRWSRRWQRNKQQRYVTGSIMLVSYKILWGEEGSAILISTVGKSAAMQLERPVDRCSRGHLQIHHDCTCASVMSHHECVRSPFWACIIDVVTKGSCYVQHKLKKKKKKRKFWSTAVFSDKCYSWAPDSPHSSRAVQKCLLTDHAMRSEIQA